MREAFCYLTIELDGDLIAEKPLEEMARLLRVAADKINEYEDDQDFDEVIVFKQGRRKCGQMDLSVLSPEEGD